MSQTNVRVPIERGVHEDFPVRPIDLTGTTAPGPISLGETPRCPGSSVLMHGRREEVKEAPDLRYGDYRTQFDLKHMAGREHAGPDPSIDETCARLGMTRLVGGNHSVGGPLESEGTITLPKDQ